MNIVSLFAGCGGLDLGFEKAGFNVIWANEFDKAIHATYRLNHPKTILNTSDIRVLSSNDIPDCDGIIGGPPCQAWSEGGKGLGIEDPRGQLILDYIRIVKDKKPKFFVIENVQGILEEKHKVHLDSFMSALCDTGYNVTHKLLNAADYKIPQDRFRVFFIGIRNDFPNRFVFPNAIDTEHITLKHAIGDIVETPRFYSVEEVECDHPLRSNHDVYTGAYDSKYMARNRVRSWDEPSFTIQAQARNTPQHPQAPKMSFISSSQRIFANGYEHLYRRLSIRECARIQTFPDNFKFIYKDVKDGYKIVGNAVPPRLAWYIAIQIKKMFADMPTISKDKTKQMQQTVKSFPIIRMPEQHSKHIVNNTNSAFLNGFSGFELNRRVLICFVKPRNIKDYLERSAKIYYTGKKFPTTVALNKLYYFIPYLKGKGIRDLYLIKIVRVGTRKEEQSDEKKDDLRLVFEIEYISQLFDDYRHIGLKIWRTFTDTTMKDLLKPQNHDLQDRI